MTTYYAIVTFGSANAHQRIFSGKDAQRRAEKVACECKGSGSCSSARVIECQTKALALSCDISEIRRGERCVYMA